MLRLSSQSKSTPLSRVAEYSATGMCTRPKLMAPFHSTRGAGAWRAASSACPAGLRDAAAVLRPVVVFFEAGMGGSPWLREPQATPAAPPAL